MRVASDQLRIGDRLTESIYLHTDHPIVEAGKKLEPTSYDESNGF